MTPVHVLKTREPFYTDVLEGRKTFELRVDDRGIQVGDFLDLRRELDDGVETGERFVVQVTHRLTGSDLAMVAGGSAAIRSGWVLLSVQRPTLKDALGAMAAPSDPEPLPLVPNEAALLQAVVPAAPSCSSCGVAFDEAHPVCSDAASGLCEGCQRRWIVEETNKDAADFQRRVAAAESFSPEPDEILAYECEDNPMQSAFDTLDNLIVLAQRAGRGVMTVWRTKPIRWSAPTIGDIVDLARRKMGAMALVAPPPTMLWEDEVRLRDAISDWFDKQPALGRVVDHGYVARIEVPLYACLVHDEGCAYFRYLGDDRAVGTVDEARKASGRKPTGDVEVVRVITPNDLHDLLTEQVDRTQQKCVRDLTEALHLDPMVIGWDTLVELLCPRAGGPVS